jgi:hypothetical protein
VQQYLEIQIGVSQTPTFAVCSLAFQLLEPAITGQTTVKQVSNFVHSQSIMFCISACFEFLRCAAISSNPNWVFSNTHFGRLQFALPTF